VILICTGAFLSAETASSQVKTAKPKDSALEQLRNIGVKVSKAVLSKDTETLLRYDRPDSRDSDREVLKDNRSHLHCMLFDTSCISGGDSRSVYEIFHTAHRLEIKVRDFGIGLDGKRWGQLLFYDGSSVTDKMLRSPKFLCAQDGKKLVSWTFKRVNGRWESPHPLFDDETDGLCPE